MAPLEIDFLMLCQKRSRNYLEFGAGYSTLRASNFPELKVFSFETDINYCHFIQGKLREKGDFEKIKIVHADIGPTREYGHPEHNPDKTRLPNYLWFPFYTIKAHKFKPDLILIDGRFRVATFLKCLMEFPEVAILFDDYLDRDFYHIVQEIIRPKQTVGRIALFYAPHRLSRRKILRSLSIIQEYTLEPS